MEVPITNENERRQEAFTLCRQATETVKDSLTLLSEEPPDPVERRRTLARSAGWLKEAGVKLINAGNALDQHGFLTE